MTSKVRVRLDNHVIIEFVDQGVILHNPAGTNDIQEDVCTTYYDKTVYTDKGVFLNLMGTMWDNNKDAGCW